MKNNMKNRVLWNDIKPYIKMNKKEFLFIIFFAIIANILGVLSPYLIGRGIENLKDVQEKGLGNLSKIAVVLAISYYLTAIFTKYQSIKLNEVSQKIVADLRAEGYSKLSKLSLQYIDSSSHGNIMSILVNDVDNISSSISQIVSQIFISIITVTLVLGIMLWINMQLTIVQIILLILTGYFLKYFIKKSKEKMRERQKQLGSLSGYIEENFLGQWEVKSFGYEKRSIEQFKILNSAYKESSARAFFFGGFNYPTLNFIGNITYGVIVFLGVSYILKGKITLGAFTSFILYVRTFNRPIASLAEFFSVFQNMAASSERYFNFLDLKEEEESEKIIELPEKIRGEFKFQNIDFSYDGERKILDDITFTAYPGESIAIVGPTGVGKTTIINLLLRFYNPQKGKIYLDGIDIERFQKEQFRKLFGIVLQDVWLFSGTVYENIVYGNNEISKSEVENLCRQFGAEDFINKLPQGFDTVINSESIPFSLGERQLITIIRAVINKPEFLILDEATSGIDTITEKKIVKALEFLKKDRTSFIIAHRLTTVKHSDKIIVLKDGKIDEIGTHKELISKDSYYSKIYQKLE